MDLPGGGRAPDPVPSCRGEAGGRAGRRLRRSRRLRSERLRFVSTGAGTSANHRREPSSGAPSEAEHRVSTRAAAGWVSRRGSKHPLLPRRDARRALAGRERPYVVDELAAAVLSTRSP